MPDMTFRGAQYTAPLMTLAQIERVAWIQKEITAKAEAKAKAESLEDLDKINGELDALFTTELTTVFVSGGPKVTRGDLMPGEQEALDSFFLLLAEGWMNKSESTKPTLPDSGPSTGTQSNSPTATI